VPDAISEDPSEMGGVGRLAIGLHRDRSRRTVQALQAGEALAHGRDRAASALAFTVLQLLLLLALVLLSMSRQPNSTPALGLPASM